MNTQIGAGVAAVATSILAVLLVSVKPEAPLIDQELTHSDSEYLEQIFSAPIVVVGSILSDTLVRAPVPSVWTRSPLQLLLPIIRKRLFLSIIRQGVGRPAGI